jgi:hypothetical protein
MVTLNSHKNSHISSHNIAISACRFCRHYTSEGRRGGTCNILQSSVSGNWKACSAAAPFFSESPPDPQPLALQSPSLEGEFALKICNLIHSSIK